MVYKNFDNQQQNEQKKIMLCFKLDFPTMLQHHRSQLYIDTYRFQKTTFFTFKTQLSTTTISMIIIKKKKQNILYIMRDCCIFKNRAF